jgi:hypothetical protein
MPLFKLPPDSILVSEMVAWFWHERQQFSLRSPAFGLNEIEEFPEARQAITKIIDVTIRLKTGGVFAQKAGDKFFGPFSKLSPCEARSELQALFETALQTITQLPSRERSNSNPKHLASFGARLDNLAKEMQALLEQDETLAWAVSGSSGDRLLQVAKDLRWAGYALRKASRTRVLRVLPWDSPNVQIRVALNLVDTIQRCTGKKMYGEAQILISGAFAASGAKPPKWVDRLAIEMAQRQKRQKLGMMRPR